MTITSKKQLAHLFDITKCIGCQACMVACAQTNYPEMMGRVNKGWNTIATNIRKVTMELDVRPFQLLVQCQQCSNPPCVEACPFEANYKDVETGLIKVDPRKCIGCNFCITACPYDIRWSHPDNGLPMKCLGEGCEDLIKHGRQPACVSACPVEARLFGDVKDPHSEISRKIRSSRTVRLLEHKGTDPNFFVVVAK
ncbi:MAG: 4Fe-4S binding protein [Burkholderiales bacterium]|nr:4Fe-4S binding protein [Burkholderiales bacterium]